jgi:hypothetical protein
MKLKVVRRYKGPDYTIGSLYIDGKYFCDTLEDTDRGLTDAMTVEEIAAKKKYGVTAIPAGIYDVTLDVISAKFALKKQYDFCQGKLPRLINVKGFEGILIHIGNTAADSLGCILVGQNKVKGQVINSTTTYINLYEILLKDKNNITIEIV